MSQEESNKKATVPDIVAILANEHEDIKIEFCPSDETEEEKKIDDGVACEMGATEELAVKAEMTNKRIDFDKKAMRRLDTMLPVYSEEAGEGVSASELYSFVVRKAIDALFENDFKAKLDEL